jgi:hypothetical protein
MVYRTHMHTGEPVEPAAAANSCFFPMRYRSANTLSSPPLANSFSASSSVWMSYARVVSREASRSAHACFRSAGNGSASCVHVTCEGGGGDRGKGGDRSKRGWEQKGRVS